MAVRSLVRNPLLLPVALLVAVGVGGVLSFSPAGASSGSSSAGSNTNAVSGRSPSVQHVPGAGEGSGSTYGSVQSPAQATKAAAAANARGKLPAYASSIHARVVVVKGGQVVLYGSPSTILYSRPPNRYIPVGDALFQQNCASCHGNQAEGSSFAPNLQGLGPATVDFWVSTGRMPANNPRSIQAPQKPPRLSNRQALEVAAWVNSLDPAVPYVPSVNLHGANLADGASLFALNCAACHTITGAGDALAFGTFAPSLHPAKVFQVAEAIRTGPANMPRFDSGNLSDSQVRDVVAYVVDQIQHPNNAGGAGLGGVGPVAEGFVALLLGVGVLALICYWIGDRS